MKKPPTGEPYAGKPPVRFGGRGRRKPIPTPITQVGVGDANNASDGNIRSELNYAAAHGAVDKFESLRAAERRDRPFQTTRRLLPWWFRDIHRSITIALSH